MKVALVHDWLNTKAGGAERVTALLAEMYPNAPVYTILYDESVCGRLIPKDRVVTSRLQKLPAFLRRRQRLLLPLLPTAVEQWDFTGYDVVISASTAWVKGVITKPETLHLCYCHSPMRFAWDWWPNYVKEMNAPRIVKAMIHPLMSRIRVWDYYSSKRVDSWVANSKTVAERIAKYYGEESAFIYPPAETKKLKPAGAEIKSDSYLIISTLARYKWIDLAIAAFNRSGRKLVIAGDGADRARLEAMAQPNITFKGFVSEKEKLDLLAKSKALIFPGQEDFGLTPVEAMGSGTPVIAYGKGGVTETVIDKVTGLFFDQPTPESMNEAIDRFETMKFSHQALIDRAAQFSRERFIQEFKSIVEKEYDRHLKRFS